MKRVCKTVVLRRRCLKEKTMRSTYEYTYILAHFMLSFLSSEQFMSALFDLYPAESSLAWILWLTYSCCGRENFRKSNPSVREDVYIVSLTFIWGFATWYTQQKFTKPYTPYRANSVRRIRLCELINAYWVSNLGITFVQCIMATICFELLKFWSRSKWKL